MQLLNRRTFLEITGMAGMAAASGASAAWAGGHRAAEVFTADPQGGLVDSTVILGEEKAVLIDAQMNVPNARKLVEVIAATGRDLETIFITHVHPDHNLGLAIIMDRFPNARPVAHAAIQPILAGALEPMLQGMSANAPAGVFADRVVVPEALDADHILLEGDRIDVLDPMHGDTDLISALHVPVLDTLIASDFVYADTFAWTAENTTPERVALWLESLDKLEAIGASTIIPGHRQESSPNDATGIGQTRVYLAQWLDALDKAGSGEELRSLMQARNEARGMEFALEMAVEAVFPK
ncbi:MAG: MBL fold metallo-hydrolase [Pseudomonadota bacterium]